MDCGTGLAWLGFWLFAAVFIYQDNVTFRSGRDSFFQKHKTSEEKELQRIKIQQQKGSGTDPWVG